MHRFVIPCMKIDCIFYFWWSRYTPCSIELFVLQISLLLLLDQASSLFRLKHEQSNFEGPGIRLDHLLESDLSDLLVGLVEEPVGGTSQGQSPILKLLEKKVHTFGNVSSENELPVR